MAYLGIVMPTRNRVRKTLRFLECMREQTFTDFHIYMVDSNSNDQSRDLLPFAFDKMSFIHATDDEWWSAATNIGVKAALEDSAEYILTINDDAIVNSDYLEKILTAAKKAGLRIMSSRIDFMDEPGRIWSVGAYPVWGTRRIFQLRHHEKWVDDVYGTSQPEVLVETFDTPGDGVLIHNSVFHEIGFYQEKWCPMVHGDSEFIARANKKGITTFVYTGAVVYNDIYNESEFTDVLSRPKFRRRLFHAFSRFGRIGRYIAHVTTAIDRVVFDPVSDLYWRPVFYYVIRYAPNGKVISTLGSIYLNKVPEMIFGGFIRRQRARLERLAKGVHIVFSRLTHRLYYH